jgi:tetratricopeptide (TPR) repeat protein
MSAARHAAAALIVAAALFGVDRVAIVPFRCNLLTHRVQLRTERIAAAGELSAKSVARQNLEELAACEAPCRYDTNFLLAKAANQLVLQDLAGAAASYQQALAVDRRPEIYLNLGLTQLDLLQTSEAVETLMEGARFNFSVNGEVPEPVRSTIAQRITTERAAILESAARKRSSKP